jgi:hypothetical protein
MEFYVTERGSKGIRPGKLVGVWPAQRTISDDLPPSARRYLTQAIDTLHAPDGAVLLAASAVDAMLKAHGLVSGSLHKRIGQAAEQRLITEEMAAWAHEVRLGANDARHADDDHPHHEREEAERLIEFATALGEFLFVLPAKVARGRNKPIS